MVVSYQPFTEVDVPEFHEMIGYLKPFVVEKLVKNQAMKDKIMVMADEGRLRLKEMLMVCMSFEMILLLILFGYNTPGRFTLATNPWMSSNHIAFLSTAATSIDH